MYIKTQKQGPVPLGSNTCTNMIFMEVLSEEKPFLHPDDKVSFAKEHLKKPDVFSHSVLRTDKGKIELSGHNEQMYVGDKRVQTFMKRTPSPFKHKDGLIMLWAWALGVTASDTENISLLEEWI